MPARPRGLAPRRRVARRGSKQRRQPKVHSASFSEVDLRPLTSEALRELLDAGSCLAEETGRAVTRILFTAEQVAIHVAGLLYLLHRIN